MKKNLVYLTFDYNDAGQWSAESCQHGPGGAPLTWRITVDECGAFGIDQSDKALTRGQPLPEFDTLREAQRHLDQAEGNLDPGEPELAVGTSISRRPS